MYCNINFTFPSPTKIKRLQYTLTVNHIVPQGGMDDVSTNLDVALVISGVRGGGRGYSLMEHGLSLLHVQVDTSRGHIHEYWASPVVWCACCWRSCTESV